MTLLYDCSVTAESIIAKVTCNPSDGRYADSRQVVYAPIREILLQKAHDLPPIDQCLEFSGRAQVLEKIATLRRSLQADHGVE